jgi:hypothetical protein
MNSAIVENPAVLGQLRQQLEIISDLIRQGQGVQEDVAAGPTTGNAVVLDMTLGPPQLPVAEAAPDDETQSSSSEDEHDDPGEQQPVDADGAAPLAAAAGNLNAEVRRIRELVRSPEIQRVRYPYFDI